MEENVVIKKIKERYNTFTKSHKAIAQFIIDNPDALPLMSTHDLATVLNVSDPTIVRFAKALGFKGYLELKNELKPKAYCNEYYSPYSRLNRAVSNTDPTEINVDQSLMSRIAFDDYAQMSEFYTSFDRDKIRYITKMISEKQFVHVVGFGTDSVPATFLEWYLSVFGYRTRLYTDGGFASSRMAHHFEEDDLMIIFCSPRQLKVEKAIVTAAAKSNTHIIYISNGSNLEIASICNMYITLPEKSNEIINSYVTFMCLCNMIIMQLYESNKEKIDSSLQKQEKLSGLFDVLI